MPFLISYYFGSAFGKGPSAQSRTAQSWDAEEQAIKTTVTRRVTHGALGYASGKARWWGPVLTAGDTPAGPSVAAGD